MKTTLRNLGYSNAVVIPDVLLKELNIQLGDTLNVSVVDGRLVLCPAETRTQYQLADLLAKCDASAPMPDDVVAWDSAPISGWEF